MGRLTFAVVIICAASAGCGSNHGKAAAAAGGEGSAIEAGSPAGAGEGGPSGGTTSCSVLPPTGDYSTAGPFADAKMFTGVGPSNNYTLFRPDSSLGQNGFSHPIATWGNGISTTPNEYQQTLTLIATHGFVIIACNDTMAEMACLSAGLDWLIAQNTTDGPMQGKLDTQSEVTIGYSWGGGAALDTAVRPNVKATVSLHGMPPRQSGTWAGMHSPLLLFTSTGDTFVTASKYVTPNYQASQVQTFYATLQDSMAGHLYVPDPGASVCAASSVLGMCEGAAAERAPAIAWLRLWVCGDDNAKTYFYGDNCTLCQSPWIDPQRKNWQ